MKLSPFIIMGLLVGCSVPAGDGPHPSQLAGPHAGAGGSVEFDPGGGGEGPPGCGTLSQHVQFKTADGKLVSYDVLLPCNDHYHDTGDPPPDVVERKQDVSNPTPDLAGAGMTAKQTR